MNTPKNEATSTDDKLSAIDKALQAAKVRKALKTGLAPLGTEPKAPRGDRPVREPKAPTEPKRPRVSDEEKAARIAARDAERAAKNAARQTAREEKTAATATG